MSISLYSATVPVLVQLLTALSEVLKKGEAFAHQRKFDPATLLQSRLFPDMLPLVRQVQIACDVCKGLVARLAGVDQRTHGDRSQLGGEIGIGQDQVGALAALDDIRHQRHAGKAAGDLGQLPRRRWWMLRALPCQILQCVWCMGRQSTCSATLTIFLQHCA